MDDRLRRPPSEAVVKRFREAQALSEQGALDAATQVYEALLRGVPELAPAWINLGDVLRRRGDFTGARQALSKALQLEARVEAFLALALCEQQAGDTAAALRVVTQGLDAMGDVPELLYRGAVLWFRAELPERAEVACRRYLQQRPADAKAWELLGLVLERLERPHEGVQALERSVALEPAADTLCHLGVVRKRARDYQAALRAFEHAVELAPSDARAHYGLALTLLQLGQFERGWREHEWRWRVAGFPSKPREFAAPLWRGQAASSGEDSLFIHAEQGHGDTIQFLRFVPEAARRWGGPVMLQVQPGLERLVRQSLPRGRVQVVAESASSLGASGDSRNAAASCCVHCPLMTLPLALGIGSEQLGISEPYCVASAEAVGEVRRRDPAREKPKVGVVWAGASSFADDRHRSLTRSSFAPLLGLEAVSWYSLQLGPKAAWFDDLAAPQRACALDGQLLDYADTAAWLQALDLVISVDTSVAHLAGAMGRSAWVLLPFHADWRWFVDGGTSPWYPSLRLYRQERPGDWRSVIERVHGDLLTLSASPTTP